MAIEIVSFPLKNGDFPIFSIVFCRFTRPGIIIQERGIPGITRPVFPGHSQAGFIVHGKTYSAQVFAGVAGDGQQLGDSWDICDILGPLGIYIDMYTIPRGSMVLEYIPTLTPKVI